MTAATAPELVQRRPEGPLDIIGDVHGERAALERLLERLGVDVARGRAERPLVFVGDLVDRGPDSLGVIQIVRALVEQGLAQAIAGNHELNILLGLKKEGNGWFFGHEDLFHVERGDQIEEAPFQSQAIAEGERAGVIDFFSQLPLALARDDLRVVHACWDEAQLAKLPTHGWVRELERSAVAALDKDAALGAAAKAELAEFARLKDPTKRPTRLLENFMKRGLLLQNENPVALLTSGRESPISDVSKEAKVVQEVAGGVWTEECCAMYHEEVVQPQIDAAKAEAEARAKAAAEAAAQALKDAAENIEQPTTLPAPEVELEASTMPAPEEEPAAKTADVKPQRKGQRAK